MNAGAGVSRWTCTRPELEAALKETRLGHYLLPAALTALADTILARLPEAPDLSSLLRERDEARRKAEHLESQLAILTKEDT